MAWPVFIVSSSAADPNQEIYLFSIFPHTAR
jgi:hypothetical protein